MNYSQAIEYLESFSKFDIKLGLDRMKIIYDNLSKTDCKYIHIAGTNGKGSITSYISSALINSSYRVLTFKSPAIYSVREQIQINNKDISKEEFTQAIINIKKIIDDNDIKPTYFEILTAVAIYSSINCDFACIEVGMGGLYDATNVIKNKIISVIGAIDYDHKNFLGNSIEEIAKQKVGIINSNYTVMYPKQYEIVEKIIEKTCIEKKSKLIKPNINKLKIYDENFVSNFEYNDKKYIKKMLGKYQVYNSITAIEVLNILKYIGYNIKDESIYKAIKETYIEARFEKISDKPCIVLDASHNIQGIKSFLENFDKIKKDKKIYAITSMLKDKQYSNMYEISSKYVNKMYVVEIDNIRAENLDKLYTTCKKYIKNTNKYENVDEMLEDIYKEKFDFLLVYGSFYLINMLKEKLVVKYNENRE